MTDQGIIHLANKNLNSNTECDEEEIIFTPEEGSAVGYKYFEFFQKYNYISEQKVITVQRQKKKPNLKRIFEI